MMNRTGKHPDRITAQKLVDGELDHASRSQFVADIPDGSAQWKEVAMAFVEKQIFDEALNSIGRNEKTKAHVSVVARLTNGDSRRTRMQSLLWAAGLAASLLAGIFIGSDLLTSDQSSTVTRSTNANSANDSGATVESKDNSLIELNEALSRSSIPVPKEFRRALLKAGYTLKENQKMAEVQLPTGGKIEMPIRSVAVTYVGLNSFQ